MEKVDDVANVGLPEVHLGNTDLGHLVHDEPALLVVYGCCLLLPDFFVDWGLVEPVLARVPRVADVSHHSFAGSVEFHGGAVVLLLGRTVHQANGFLVLGVASKHGLEGQDCLFVFPGQVSLAPSFEPLVDLLFRLNVVRHLPTMLGLRRFWRRGFVDGFLDALDGVFATTVSVLHRVQRGCLSLLQLVHAFERERTEIVSATQSIAGAGADRLEISATRQVLQGFFEKCDGAQVVLVGQFFLGILDALNSVRFTCNALQTLCGLECRNACGLANQARGRLGSDLNRRLKHVGLGGNRYRFHRRWWRHGIGRDTHVSFCLLDQRFNEVGRRLRHDNGGRKRGVFRLHAHIFRKGSLSGSQVAAGLVDEATDEVVIQGHLIHVTIGLRFLGNLNHGRRLDRFNDRRRFYHDGGRHGGRFRDFLH